MTCRFCDSVALYRVKDRGFCGDHYAQARNAAVESWRSYQSDNGARGASAGSEFSRPKLGNSKGYRFGSKGGYGRLHS